MDPYVDCETIGGIEVGELLDINPSDATDGSTAAGQSTGAEDEQFLETFGPNNKEKSELDCYLDEIPYKCDISKSFDVLTWWMANEGKYPILSRMAKDILSIPVTTVASESTFSAGKRIIDPKRSSMSTKTVEMLLCGGDWIKELYGMKRGCSQSILQLIEEEEEEALTYNFANDDGTRASTTT